MRTTVDQVLSVARSQLGYVEGPGNASRFGAWIGADHAPWCASFVSWVLYTACHANGESSPLEGLQQPYGTSYCPYIVNWSRKAGTFRPDPAPGRLALYDWQGDGTADHVGIVVTGGVAFAAIEGNTSPADNSNGGQVMLQQRRNDHGYCLGFVDLGLGTELAPAAPAQPVLHPAPMPAAAAPPWPGRVLHLASPLMRGADVLTWQERMSARGWKIDRDGIYGPQSAAVCSAFEREKGLTVDGAAGPVVWTAAWTLPRT